MSYNTDRGRNGEVELARFLTGIFDNKYKWVRMGGVERNKQFFPGDVALMGQTDCPLIGYIFDAKNQKRPDIFGDLSKAEEDIALWNGKGWNLKGAILYIIKHDKGKRGERLVAMSPKTFESIVRQALEKVPCSRCSSIASSNKTSSDSPVCP